MTRESELRQLIEEAFNSARIAFEDIRIRSFPGEHIVVVEVASNLDAALRLANSLDERIDDGFVTVKQVEPSKHKKRRSVDSVRDERVTKLIETLDARSRTSEAQPSLKYVSDVEGRLSVALAPRHHLIFGRRGVGKTALMLEAKRLAEEKGSTCIWLNLQSIRGLGPLRAFLTVASRLCELPELQFGKHAASRRSGTLAAPLQESITNQLDAPRISPNSVRSAVPRVQEMLNAFCAEADTQVFVFLDDVHYLAPSDGPEFLDLVHGATRDTPTWLKVAGIRHQMKWFSAEARMGLESGHDASEINLDVTLEAPERAKQFLETVLNGYIQECGAMPRRGFLSDAAIDRLVLASGGVPRDFTILCAEAIQGARKRANARVAGVQEVNQAAGAVAKSKVSELEDDAASDVERAKSVLHALQVVREFLLTDWQITFLRIDFLDKETHPDEYSIVQGLMDFRMLHLLNAGVSDPHQAGRRSEVYLFDLSQYSGSRLKQHLRVLDFENNHLVLKRTRSQDPVRVGDTARKLVAILRQGPKFDLSLVSRES